MMKSLLRLFSHNSYLWLALAVGLVLFVLLAGNGLTFGKWVLLAVYGMIVAGVFLTMRTPRSKLAHFDELAAVEKALRGDRPTLLEFYSENCAVCMAMRPVMDRLEGDAGHRLQILRVNVKDPIGQQLAERYRVTFTPSFLLFNSYGNKEDEFTLVLDRARVIYWLDQQTISP